MLKSQNTFTNAIKHWQHIAPIVRVPKNDREFDKLTTELDELLDIIGNDEKHPLISLVDVISNIIEYYEYQKYQNKFGKNAIDALKHLMQNHHLTQSDFSEIASQGVMSEILNGKRKLNLRQIKLLAKRFHVNPETFI